MLLNEPKRVALALLFISFVSASEDSFHRGLKLECPVDEFNQAEKTNEKVDGRFDAYSKGENGRQMVEMMRKRSESFYQNVVDNVIMFMCNVEEASERCVEKDSLYAAKDWTGENCIKASGFECPSGTCERTSNCYWNSVLEGKERNTRFPVDDYEKARDKLIGTHSESYIADVARFGFIGIIVSIVLLLLWAIFLIGRFLCCCLWIPCDTLCFVCSPIPRRDGYKTCKEVIIPIICYFIALVMVAASTGIAFVGNEDISVAVSNTFLHADGLVQDLALFLGRNRIPLENIQGIVSEAALDAKSIFDGTEYVKTDALEIVDSFVGFYNLHSDGLNASSSLEGFNTATLGFEEKVTPIIDNVQYMLDTLQMDLYEQADTIEGGISGAIGQLDSFSSQSLEWQAEIYYYEAQELGFRAIRRSGVLAIFLASFAFGLLGLLGIIGSKTVCRKVLYMLQLTGIFSTLLGTVSLVFASILLVVSFFLHDACEMSGIITRDFEPFVGDKVATGANACFNDTNLAEAFNMTEKVNFQQKLDEGLERLDTINVSQSFQIVLGPLSDIHSILGSVSDSALSAINQVTSSNEFPCPFTDVYTKETIMEPWELNSPTAVTPYVIRDNFGNPISYTRMASETAESYLGRIYNKAGVCSAESSCCIAFDPLDPTCESEVYDDCDLGDNCVYPCENLKLGIVEGYKAFAMLYNKERRMNADLGVVCPADFDDSCPTAEFKATYANTTLVGLIENYKVKIIGTKNSLVSLASTSVGGAMAEVEDFLCNMNVSFVERRYDEVKDDICIQLYGGVAQINWALWMLGISLEVIAILAHVLVVRLRGVSDKEAALGMLYSDSTSSYY